jgi:hypothetical protein
VGLTLIPTTLCIKKNISGNRYRKNFNIFLF